MDTRPFSSQMENTPSHCDRGPRAWGFGECARLCVSQQQQNFGIEEFHSQARGAVACRCAYDKHVEHRPRGLPISSLPISALPAVPSDVNRKHKPSPNRNSAKPEPHMEAESGRAVEITSRPSHYNIWLFEVAYTLQLPHGCPCPNTDKVYGESMGESRPRSETLSAPREVRDHRLYLPHER